MPTDRTKSQLAMILSALDGARRNPNTKDAALRAIARHGARLGLRVDDILARAAGLLDGRMSAEEFRARLAAHDAETTAEADALAANERRAVSSDGTDEPRARDDADTADPLAIPEPLPREPVAEPADEPDQRVIPKRTGPAKPRTPREGSKQARMIAMLQHPEGATIAQIRHETGVEWGESALSPCGNRFLHPPLRTGRAVE